MKQVTIKSAEEMAKMRRAGELAAQVLEMLTPHVKIGVTTEQLNQLCHDYIVHEQQAIPAPLNYRGFPKSICTSVNHVVCHGIPSADKYLKAGDILNVDITVVKEGYHGDTSKMFLLGEPTVLAKRLCQVCHECLWLGIEQVRPGAHLGNIGQAIAEHAQQHRFSVVETFCGHGIGRHFHEAPDVMHTGKANTGLVLQPGMTFTIEPMINAGKKHTKILKDGWTAVTKDRSLSAQWEHTLAVTETGYEVLTLRHEEQ
jgi:methionyl aminopeptidase